MADEPPAQARNRSSKVWVLSRPQGMSLSTLQLGPRRWTEDAPTAGPVVRGAGPRIARPRGATQGRRHHAPSPTDRSRADSGTCLPSRARQLATEEAGGRRVPS